MIHFWKKKIANTRNSVTNEASLQGNIFIQTRQEYYTKKQKKKKKKIQLCFLPTESVVE